MSRIWFCRNCGYEVRSRGRCHSCKEKLTPSALPELAVGSEDDEVGYRIDGWGVAERGELIVRLNDLGIPHRFEDEELVVDAADEDRVDDLVAILGDLLSERGPYANPVLGSDTDDSDDSDEPSNDFEAVAVDADADADVDTEAAVSRTREGTVGGGAEPGRSDADKHPEVAAAVRLLSDAVDRLCKDPTDMQADADVAEASAWVFTVERYANFDDQEWAAIGRVTRRLLSLLGADEALEEDISIEAAVLQRLLAPVAGTSDADTGDPVTGAVGTAAERTRGTGVSAFDADDPSKAGVTRRSERTVYELPDWLPDQRAQLEVRLEQSGIDFEWEGDDLLVPADQEEKVDEVFDQIVGGSEDADDDADERRYQALTELFAATGRLAADPADRDRREATLDWASSVGGAPLLGMDEIDWFRIMSKLRTLVGAIDEDSDTDFETVAGLAEEMHELLRSVV